MIAPHARVGAAIHSVRAVPPEQMHPVVAWTRRRGAPLHVHMSEQRAENEACLAVYGVSPARLLYDEDVLGPADHRRARHARHRRRHPELLGGAPGVRLPVPHHRTRPRRRPRPRAAAGRGRVHAHPRQRQPRGDRHARGGPRRRVLPSGWPGRSRGHFTAERLLRAATCDGHASLGWPDAGEIAPGARADLVTVALDSVRTAGADDSLALETAVFARHRRPTCGMS